MTKAASQSAAPRGGAPENAAEAAAALARGEPSIVWRRIIADSLTPVGAARRLMKEERGDFLLESVEGGETRGRYSLLGLNPDLVFKAHKNKAAINTEWQSDRAAFQDCPQPPLNALRALVHDCRFETPANLPGVLSCLVGYFGFETIGYVERLPRAADSALELPDMLFVRPTVVLIFDGLTDELWCASPIWSSDDPKVSIKRAAERIDAVLAALAAPLPATQAAARGTLPLPETLEFTPAIAPQDYLAMVGRAKDYITAGDIFQVVLAQRFSCPFALAPLELYRALRRINPSPFLYFLDFPDFSIVGSSPEILVRVRQGEGGGEEITIRPIAGTRPRGATPALDAANEKELLADPKELAEHLMLLDLGRNDVGRVAATRSVEVTDSFSIERYSHVMHIVSNVIGRLDEGRDALDALFAGFPAGTVSGAPKLRACEIISELEPETRGPYAGGVGYFAPDGSIDACIVLRTAVVKDDQMHVQAGAGIVAESDPQAELAECSAKAGALIAAAREAVRIASDIGYGQ